MPKNFQYRSKFFYASEELFKKWPYKSRLAIGMNLKDFLAKDSKHYRFNVKGKMYSIPAERANQLGNRYYVKGGILPNILPLEEFNEI